MERSDGAQIPAEYSRLVGADIFLAGPTAPMPAPPPLPTLPKAEAVKIPTPRAIHQLAAAGRAAECIDALRLTAAAHGPGDFAAAPLDALLESAKETLKEITAPSPKVEDAGKTCQLVLDAIRDCLPPDHSKNSALNAKAHNRLGDCLLLSGRADKALLSYQAAAELTPEDSFPIFNRGRAHLALGHTAEAKADLTTATNPKFNQPTARKLAEKALSNMP